MVALARHLLPPELRRRLSVLAHNFESPKRKSEPTDAVPRPLKKAKLVERQPKKPEESSKRPGPMNRLIAKKSLQLSTVFEDHIRVNGTDGQAFIENEIALVHHAHHLGEEEGLCEVFAACYHFITNLEERNEMDHARRCFTMIMFSDFMELLHPRPMTGTPVARTRRVGHRMHERAVEFLDTTFSTNPEMLVEAKDNMTKWCRWGDKLVALCDKFGEGSIFYLEANLSDDL